jgi:site-specific recombinase
MLRKLDPKNKPLQKTGESAVVLPIATSLRGIDLLVRLFDTVRPDHYRDREQATLRFQSMLFELGNNRGLSIAVRKSLLRLLAGTSILEALTESGMLSGRGFVQELTGKLKHKLLRESLPRRNFLFVVNRVFYRKKDFIWVSSVDPSLWKNFFDLLGIQISLTNPQLTAQCSRALQLISHRIAGLGIEKEITHRFDNFDDAVYPFLEQNRLITLLLQELQSPGSSAGRHMLVENIAEALHNCNQSIRWIREQRAQYGTSLAQNYLLTRLRQHIDRAFILLDVLDANGSFDTYRFVDYFTRVVHYENTRNSLREFFSENTGFLAYQIAEHSGRTGEKFITTTRKEYWRMLRSAAGGGIIISFIGIIKNLLGNLTFAPFWQSFLYGVNYATGFILIQETGSTLATKQPAYTANNVASSLDTRRLGDKPDLRNLAITVAKVSRTQIASFAGNLLLVFPLTYMLAWAYTKMTGVSLAGGEKAMGLIRDQQIFNSLSLLYACITGFFLFASGLVAGFVENYVVYGKIGDRLRLASGPFGRLTEKRKNRIVNYVENNSGALAGNIALGFFLGMAGFFGKIFGLPFDIRHITISAANATIGFFGIGHQLPWKEVVYTLLSVGCIGFLNFAVSFGLSFYMAVKSRGILLKDYPEFLSMLWRYFKRYPGDFFRPPSFRAASHLK